MWLQSCTTIFLESDYDLTYDELHFSLIERLEHGLRDEFVKALLKGQELLLDSAAPTVIYVKPDILALVFIRHLKKEIVIILS